MRTLLTLVLLLFAGWLPGAGAQEGASLAEVENLMAAGHIMDARAALESWWNLRFSNAPRDQKQRGIWLRGRLTVDPSMADLDYRRLVLEYPGGPFSDDALFRIGQSAENRGDLREAQRSFQTLIRDYPSSPRASEARGWLRDHAEAIASLPVLERPAEPERPTSDDPLGGRGDYAVQLGAFRSLERAMDLARELRDEGYRVRLVRTPGNELARVRVGRFDSRLRAEALARELAGRGFETTLAMDASTEERIGRDSGRV